MITVSFGPGNSKQVDEAVVPTTEAIRNSRDLQAALGFDPAAIGFQVNDTAVTGDHFLVSGDTVRLFARANNKA